MLELHHYRCDNLKFCNKELVSNMAISNNLSTRAVSDNDYIPQPKDVPVRTYKLAEVAEKTSRLEAASFDANQRQFFCQSS
jgi:hypothetical protein